MDIEQQILAAGADVAPRVTRQMVHNAIVATRYFTAADGCAGEYAYRHACAGGELPPMDKIPAVLALTTFCALVLDNGFTIFGKSAVASPKNFNADIGRRVAYDDAINQVWQFLGFRLMDQQNLTSNGQAAPAAEPDFRARVRIEAADLTDKVQKLMAFVAGTVYPTLSNMEQNDLSEQLAYMQPLLLVLKRRIARWDQEACSCSDGRCGTTAGQPAFETRTYSDGTVASGPGPLPPLSAAEQEAQRRGVLNTEDHDLEAQALAPEA